MLKLMNQVNKIQMDNFYKIRQYFIFYFHDINFYMNS